MWIQCIELNFLALNSSNFFNETWDANKKAILLRYQDNFVADGATTKVERFECDLVLNVLPEAWIACGFPGNETKDEIGSDIYYKVGDHKPGKWTK